MLLALTLTAGCTPGTIREYTAKAQRAGEVMFEGKTQDVLAEGAETAGREAMEAKETETAEAGTESSDQTGSSVTETESAAGAESAAEPESAAAASEPVGIPALMSEVPEELSGLIGSKGADFTGKLAGKDRLYRTETAAMEAVLSQERYDDQSLCMQNMARYDGSGSQSFLLIFESTPLTARQRIEGDLWYFDGETAKKLLEDTVFTGVQLVQGDENPYLIVRMQEEKQEKAAVYTVTKGQEQILFADAISIHATEGGIRVDYPAEAFRYDPLAGEWADGTGTVPYFYARTAEGFTPLIWKELSVQQYLSYAQAEEADAAAYAYQKELEEKFYTGTDSGTEYTYEFFAIGDGRIGYRQRSVGKASENSGEIGHAVAEYTWQIFMLDNGKLTEDGVSFGGEGYYFENREEQQQELESLNEIPAGLQAYRISDARQGMRAAEKKALESVLAAQEYPEEALCFVSAADFDQNGSKEAFAAVGRYDGAFGAPVCDLWYAGGTAQLLAENIPLKGMEKIGAGNAAAQLVRGYEIDGKRDFLFTVKDGAPVRCLETMGSFAVRESGGLAAWAAGEEPSAPAYFHMEKGEAVPYGTSEIPLENILDYANGKAVYTSLLRQAGNDAAKIVCLQRENGLIHITLSDGDSRFYETYEVQEEKLVLTDSGEGGYSPAAQADTAQAAQAGSAEEGQTEETTETRTEESAETKKE